MCWLGAGADLDERRFWSPIMRREWDYLAALQEVGHLVLERRTKPQSTDSYPTLNQE